MFLFSSFYLDRVFGESSSTLFAYKSKDKTATRQIIMSTPNSLLGPILGGLLGFFGAIGAAIVAFILARRDRGRRMDEERVDARSHELDHIPHITAFPHQGAMTVVADIHYTQHRWVKF
ncbi:hypothetical protein F4680DRAFT_136308 [Xylaria scruposa]|nr:hypothetical protein F4680DRAFT_136308 [Xylaria scruposa]